MAEKTLLEKVKDGLGITSTAQDDTLKVYIDSVKAYMKDAGVRDSVLASSNIDGAVLCGVNDLWNYNGGSQKFSPFFMQRVAQLVHKEISTNA